MFLVRKFHFGSKNMIFKKPYFISGMEVSRKTGNFTGMDKMNDQAQLMQKADPSIKGFEKPVHLKIYTEDKKRIFTDFKPIQCAKKKLIELSASLRVEISGYDILPDHLQLAVILGSTPVVSYVQTIKKELSSILEKECQLICVWQKGFYAI